MNDLIDRQAAIEALGEKPFAGEKGDYEEGLQNQWERDADAIKILPSVDAVPVVRCRECKHYKPEVGDDEYALGWCPFAKSHLVLSNGFCFWGERNEDGNEHD